MHSSRESWTTVTLVACLVAAGCKAPVDEPVPPATPAFPDGWEDGGELVCAAPYAGVDRLVESAAERGLSAATFNARFGPVFVLAHDIDADDDVDILYFNDNGRLQPFLNDGSGFFSAGEPVAPPPFGPSFLAMGLADDDGDGLPELFLASTPNLWRYPNRGGGLFSTPTMLWSEDPPDLHRYPALSIADADGDGDLDVAMFAHQLDTGAPGDDDDSGGGPMDFEGTRDMLIRLDGATLVEAIELAGSAGGTLGLVGTFTDRDGDGDQDLFIPSDRDLPAVFWRNDGPGDGSSPTFVDDSAAISANVALDAMGIDAADLNQDGQLDYCMSDTGTPKCLLSGVGGYVESGVALGLDPDTDFEPATIGWSIEFVDLDHDGWLDLVQASGPLPDGPGGAQAWPDLCWKGQPDGTFDDVTVESGFGSLAENYGLATADFDGDGSLDVVRLAPGVPPSLLLNRCSAGAWLDFELVGLAANREALGARIEVTSGGFTHLREMQSVRGQGQSPSRLHFGLGGVEAVGPVRIVWPDGAVSEAATIPVNRRVVVTHPAL